MLEIEITKIERKNDWKNRLDEWGEIGAKIYFHSPGLSKDLMPDELGKYFSNISNGDIRNLNAFTELQSKEYYLISKEELLNICQKAFSTRIVERILDEATSSIR